VAEARDPVTATVTAEVHNGGASEARDVLVRFSRDGNSAGEARIPTIAAGGTAEASVVWPRLALGRYEVEVEVDLEGRVVECDSSNNRLTAEIVLEVERIYLPVLIKMQ
jgi:subtilase family serine protease